MRSFRSLFCVCVLGVVFAVCVLRVFVFLLVRCLVILLVSKVWVWDYVFCCLFVSVLFICLIVVFRCLHACVVAFFLCRVGRYV